VKYIFPYFITFLFAYWLAKCAIPIAFFLHEKFRFPRILSNIITLSLILIVLGTILYLLAISLIQQLNLLIEHFPSYRISIQSNLTNMCSCCDKFFKLNDGTSVGYIFSYIDSLFQKGGAIFSSVTRQTVSFMFQTIRLFIQFSIIVLSAILIMQDHTKLKNTYHYWFLYEDVEQILKQLSKTGLTYMKMQFIIMSVIAVQCTLGLFLSQSSYPLLLGILIALLDALPLFGSGTILVPWAIIKLFSHNIIGAAILMSTYLICQITRQFLESRLLGDTLGLAPIYFVMSLFIGIEFYGVTGIILGPFSVLFIRTLYNLYKPAAKRNQHE
jgi:sporulation integral membrane protein YtvI